MRTTYHRHVFDTTIPTYTKTSTREWRPRLGKAARFAVSEFSGTAVAIFLGICANLSSAISLQQGQSVRVFGLTSWAWGLAFMAGSSLTARTSGAHLNPALSIAFAIVRDLSPLNALVYIAGQMLGGFVGAGVAYLIHSGSINNAGLDKAVVTKAICAGPASQLPASSAFITEYTTTALLMLLICTLAVGRIDHPGADISSVKVGLINTLIMMALGYQTGPVLNPARDTGPRLIALFIGGEGLFRDGFWWYGAWMATVSGAISGVFVHDKILCHETSSMQKEQPDVPLDEVVVCLSDQHLANNALWTVKSGQRWSKRNTQLTGWPCSMESRLDHRHESRNFFDLSAA